MKKVNTSEPEPAEQVKTTTEREKSYTQLPETMKFSTGILLLMLLASVISSAYSSSPPKAIPLAMVVIFMGNAFNFRLI